jgi:alkanesulfonate monooxygenase SsuD/methylene tetrahydromethanopterin reductase-like flavin-dependent oxidoreductase (luciferase family)
MVHVADSNQRAYDEAAESMVWYPKAATRFIGALADWMAGEDLGSYQYALEIKKLNESGVADRLGFDYVRDSGAAVVGDPDRAIELARRYEAAGCQLLFCLVNPYKIPHQAVMRSIELLGKHVIPELDR